MSEPYNETFIHQLRIIWNYMKLNQKIEKCDVIIACGCGDLKIPIRCAELYKEGMAPKILFTGALGKGTEDKFQKTEAELFRDIAIEEGVPKKDILIEKQSTNTGDNFRFGEKILKKNKISFDKVLIVHNSLSERRSLSSAKTILTDSILIITSPQISFDEFLEKLRSEEDYGKEQIEIILGDIQRIVMYPQFGWQTENELPDEVLAAYNYIKNLGYTRYLIDENKYNELVAYYGIAKGKKTIFFY